jgi:hypothetical protein
MLAKRNAPAQKPNKTLWTIIGICSVGAVLYFYTGGDDTPAPVKKTLTSSSKTDAGNTELIPADYKIHFAALDKPAKDAFTPLITKGGAAGADDGSGIPAWASGGGDWQYNGMVQVNGTPEALLENAKTQDMVYVGLEQRWKKAKVKRISDSAIELLGDDGKTVTVKMSEGPKETTPVASANPVPAADPTQAGALAGPIGPVDVTALPGIQFQQGGGRGFGGGRRRRGFGGMSGFGGGG